jgi:hypothetical protein
VPGHQEKNPFSLHDVNGLQHRPALAGIYHAPRKLKFKSARSEEVPSFFEAN